jgi:hypothetical protein
MTRATIPASSRMTVTLHRTTTTTTATMGYRSTTRCLSYQKLQIFVTSTFVTFVTVYQYFLVGQFFTNIFRLIFWRIIVK